MDSLKINKLDSKVIFIVYFMMILFGSYYISTQFNSDEFLDLNNSKVAGKLLGILGKFALIGFVLVKLLKGIINVSIEKLRRVLGVLVLGNILVYTIVYFVSSPQDYRSFFDPSAIKFFFGYFIFSIAVWLMNIPNYREFKNRFFISNGEEINYKRYLFRSVGYSLATLFVLSFLNSFFEEKIFFLNKFSVITTIIVTVVFVVTFYIFEAKKIRLEAKVDEQTQRAESVTAQYEGLKSQIDPHFLFNSLNVLTSLIEENPEKASEFTQDLSKIYRYVLESKEQEVVDAMDEINFAKKYINLLQIRYEDSLQWEIEDGLVLPYEKIIPLSLQLLLENAIKHNIVSPQKPLKIRIYKEDRNLVVENNLQRKETNGNSTKIGLQNIINRYKHLTNHEVIIEESSTHFIVKIPLLTQKQNSMEIIQNPSEEDRKYIEKRAAKRAKELKDYYSHLTVYIVLSIFFFVLNAITAFGHWWFYWPILGWGIGVLFHTLETFAIGKNWEENKKRELIERETKKWN